MITYASKALSPVEQRYSQTEREALAVVWACEHSYVYIFGAPVTVVTDHKPLLGIYGKASSRTSARLERWCLRLIPYDMTLTYEPVHQNPADYISRHPNNANDTDCRATRAAEDYIQLITEEAKPTVTDLEDLIAESNSDETLSIVRDTLTYGKWPMTNTDPDIKLYSDIKDRIAEEKVKNCFPCQAVTPQHTCEPTQVTLTNRPWDQVSCDFADVGNGEYIMIIIDDFTRYPEVVPLKTLTATKVIHEMDTIFSRFGNPNILKTDNGPPFNSHKFASYMNDNGIKHHRITPLCPEAMSQLRWKERTGKRKSTSSWNTNERLLTHWLKSHQQKECSEETSKRVNPHGTTALQRVSNRKS